MRTLSTLFFIIISLFTFGQTWSDNVAQIFYNKCTQCHHTGGVAPFPLMTYAEASPLTSIITTSISTDDMPPWPPENGYQSYTHNRSLSPTEKTTILDWISNGFPEGNQGSTPPPPVYTGGAILGNGDLELQIPTYASKATGTSDDYVCFAIPSGLATNRMIKSVEIIPGNPAIVHHALIYIDPANSSVTDTIGGDCAGPTTNSASLVTGYTPGSSPMTLPATNPLKLGIPFQANSQVLFAMHYPEGSFGEVDSTKVIFHFYPPGETGVRDVLTSSLLENWSFTLPADQITNVSAQYPPSGGLSVDVSLLSVFPHMHLIGESMRVYGIEPSLDTLKLINVPEWNFEWQDFYFYKNIQKATAGTTLKVDAVYNNTAGNPNNPNVPPENVSAGLNTSDEMCLVFMHYMAYQAGDENYNMDSLMNLSTASIIENEENYFSVYPNPFIDELNLFSKKLASKDQLRISIYNGQGSLIKSLLNISINNGSEFHIKWDGKDSEGKTTSPGLYFVSINLNGEFYSKRVIKKR